MNRRSGTAPTHRRDETPRLVVWLALVGLLILLAYASPKPPPGELYKWSTAANGLIFDAIVLAVVLAIARPNWSLLAWRRPAGRFALLAIATLVGILVFEPLYDALVHPGNEQGLTVSHWEPRHAAAYVVNTIVICTWVPFVEETTYRGLGYSLLERFGRWPAILAVGLLFGLSHGLAVSLPVLIAFGAALAWIRSRTQSVVVGMVVHGSYNLIILVATVVH